MLFGVIERSHDLAEIAKVWRPRRLNDNAPQLGKAHARNPTVDLVRDSFNQAIADEPVDHSRYIASARKVTVCQPAKLDGIAAMHHAQDGISGNRKTVLRKVALNGLDHQINSMMQLDEQKDCQSILRHFIHPRCRMKSTQIAKFLLGLLDGDKSLLFIH